MYKRSSVWPSNYVQKRLTSHCWKKVFDWKPSSLSIRRFMPIYRYHWWRHSLWTSPYRVVFGMRGYAPGLCLGVVARHRSALKVDSDRAKAKEKAKAKIVFGVCCFILSLGVNGTWLCYGDPTVNGATRVRHHCYLCRLCLPYEKNKQEAIWTFSNQTIPINVFSFPAKMCQSCLLTHIEHTVRGIDFGVGLSLIGRKKMIRILSFGSLFVLCHKVINKYK